MTSNPFNILSLGKPNIPTPLELASELNLVDDTERLLANPYVSELREALNKPEELPGFELAGPRARLFFDPAKVCAAIVTCGGLCPGINAVIRSVVLELWHRYGCKSILGIKNGFGGFAADAAAPLSLTPELVSEIHTRGGTILGSSRGTPSSKVIVDRLVELGINCLFTIGGDGTMRGTRAIADEISKRGLKIAVVSIPKTIDNDIPFVRRSFGFETAVSVATQPVHAAHIEATGARNGIGLVKLMGRHAGYIAAYTVLASGHANCCLIPEVPFGLEGAGGLLERLEKRMGDRGHAVIVVAEGAGQYFFSGQEQKKDASGNVKLGDIGQYLRDRISAHFAQKGMATTVKYIDPSYMIRAAPANPFDQLHCARFAQNAVHAAMAGKTNLLIGYWHGAMTHVPIAALEGRTHNINPQGELWFNVLENTGQPVRIGEVPQARSGG